MNESKKENVIIILLIMIIVLLLAIIIYVVFNPKDNKKEDNKPTNNTPTIEENKVEDNKQTIDDNKVNQEVEVNINDYKYLVERLEKSLFKFNIKDYLNISSLTDEVKVHTAVAGLTAEKLNFKTTDSFDVSEGYNVSAIFDNFKNGYNGYSTTNVENEVKKIYGKNTSIIHKAYGPIAYDKTIKAYLIIPSGSGNTTTTSQSINKITKDNNNIYIYVTVGLTAEFTGEICYDINCNNSIKKSSIDKKYISDDEGIDIEQYMKDNKDKFEQYKYTFEKEDNNYIIKKLEKIN